MSIRLLVKLRRVIGLQHARSSTSGHKCFIALRRWSNKLLSFSLRLNSSGAVHRMALVGSIWPGGCLTLIMVQLVINSTRWRLARVVWLKRLRPVVLIIIIINVHALQFLGCNVSKKDIVTQGCLGAGTCANEILGVGQSSKLKCYFRISLFSSIQLLFLISSFSSVENLLTKIFLHLSSLYFR